MKRLMVALLLVGCAADRIGTAEPAPAPLVGGKADTFADVADHECRVVLRHVEPAGGAVRATLDVAQSLLNDPGATAAVLFRADGSGWQSIDATAVEGAPAGFRRFQAQIAEASSLDLVAYARTTTQVRLFDHNRLTGDLDNLHLDASTGFTFADDAAVCPGSRPRGEIDFQIGYTQVQHGAVIRGGVLDVNYALDRLTTCRSTHNGFRFWSLDAQVRFAPGGQTATATVVASNGTAIFPATASFDVPADATSVEIWFRNATPPSCEGYDSNLGANYRFPVVAAPAPIGWVGDWGSSTNRSCTHQAGVADPIVIDEYVRERACVFIDADVWVPGAEDHAEWIQAQVLWTKNGTTTTAWLAPQGRFGNNQRFRFDLPYELRGFNDWTTATYAFRFSTDGNHWISGPTRSFQHAP